MRRRGEARAGWSWSELVVSINELFGYGNTVPRAVVTVGGASFFAKTSLNRFAPHMDGGVRETFSQL